MPDVPRAPAPTASLVPLADQDRTSWDRARIREGIDLVERDAAAGPVGPYQLQAAIAAVHAEAAGAERHRLAQIELLYRMLDDLAPSPVVTLNHAVAVARSAARRRRWPCSTPAVDRQLRHDHRPHAVHAHLLERLGRRDEAAAAYALAARLATSIPEQRHLNDRAASAQGQL